MVRHRVAGKKLSRPESQRTAMLRSLASDVIRHGRVITTEAKASETRRVVERLVTHGKKGTLHHRRLVSAQISSKHVINKLFDELAPQYASRPGGYTRIIKLGPRKGDAAPMALVELV